MKLVYKKSGKKVEIGDQVRTSKGVLVEVLHFSEPTRPNSSGRVHVRAVRQNGWNQEFYVAVIGAEWIEREDLA